MHESSFGEKYRSGPRFRTKISLYIGLAANIFYIAIKLYAGIRFRSAWFLALAVYYVLLAAMRLVLVGQFGEKRAGLEKEFRLYRLCGIILLVMNQALAVVVILMVKYGRGFDYPGYLIYAMAFYSFYAVITAAIGVVKIRKHESPVLSAAKVINLVAALVSILSLTTAMLSRFGQNDPAEFRTTMTASVGGSVCTIVILLAGYMIFRAWKEAPREREGK